MAFRTEHWARMGVLAVWGMGILGIVLCRSMDYRYGASQRDYGTETSFSRPCRPRSQGPSAKIPIKISVQGFDHLTCLTSRLPVGIMKSPSAADADAVPPGTILTTACTTKWPSGKIPSHGKGARDSLPSSQGPGGSRAPPHSPPLPMGVGSGS